MQRTPRTDNHPGTPEITPAPRTADKKNIPTGQETAGEEKLNWYVKTYPRGNLPGGRLPSRQTYPIDRKSHVKKIDKKA